MASGLHQDKNQMLLEVLAGPKPPVRWSLDTPSYIAWGLLLGKVCSAAELLSFSHDEKPIPRTSQVSSS